MTEGYTQILQALADTRKFDLDDPNLQDTPRRVMKSMLELTDGYADDPVAILSKSFPSEGYDQMIVVKDIDYFSLCSHHLLPFYGKVAVGYIPNSKTREVVGLSKIPRLVRCFSRRLQLQERMTSQIAEAIQTTLYPRGVGVLVYDSVHLCSHMRGIEESHSTMETAALHGDFRTDPAVRSEFYSMVYGRKS
jgi:GTP cyclohydrolase I